MKIKFYSGFVRRISGIVPPMRIAPGWGRLVRMDCIVLVDWGDKPWIGGFGANPRGPIQSPVVVV